MLFVDCGAQSAKHHNTATNSASKFILPMTVEVAIACNSILVLSLNQALAATTLVNTVS